MTYHKAAVLLTDKSVSTSSGGGFREPPKNVYFFCSLC